MEIDEETWTFQAPNGFVYGIWMLMRFGGKYTGSYPPGLLKRAKKLIPYSDPILHVCSGSIKEDICLDQDSEGKPTVVSLAERMPFKDDSFGLAIADPPYSPDVGSARGRFAGPNVILRDMARVVRPGGFVCMLHWLVPMTPPECEKWGLVAIATGANKKMRALTIFRKKDA